jgi:quinol monooxygenase YgiN
MSTPVQTGFNIQATLFFAPEDIPKVLEALKSVYEKTIAERECRSFQVYQLRDVPGEILLVEDWYVQVFIQVLKYHRACHGPRT